MAGVLDSGRAVRLCGLVGLTAVTAIAGASVHSLWQIHVDDPHWRSGLETLMTLSAVASLGLLVLQFRHTRRVRDLVLLAAVAAAGVTGFVLNTLPGYGYALGIYGAGARAALVLLVAAAFLAVAFTPGGLRLAPGRQLVKLAIPGAIGWVALGQLVDLVSGPVRARGPVGAFHALSIGLAVIGFTALVVAAGKLANRRAHGEPAAGLLAGAAFMIGLAQLARPTIAVEPATWVTLADLLRGGAWLMLLAAGITLVRVAQLEKAQNAVVAERRRIARDLHDGLAQDLAFIGAHSGRLTREYGADHPLAIAARRALATSRGTIVDLEAADATSTVAALRVVAAELARRFQLTVEVIVDGSLPVDHSDADRHELVRSAREAIANAAHHGRARHVTVRLGARGDDLLLRVTDDGCGFGHASPRTAGTGLGMRAMRGRAASLGAELRTGESSPGHTVLDIVSRDRRASAR